MISDKFNCIFVHIPKTAGQSIENFFLSLHGLSWEERAPLLLRYNLDPEQGPQALAHLTAMEYVEFNHISSETFNKYFKFAFVRNPWDRLVSEYNYRNYNKKYTFKEFVNSGFPDKDNFSDAYRHIIPQYDLLYSLNGELLVDFVGKFEDLQNDFNIVCLKLGISTSLLPHINSFNKERNLKNRLRSFLFKTKKIKKHYTEYYDDELKNKVGKIYSKDISAFNYTFSG